MKFLYLISFVFLLIGCHETPLPKKQSLNNVSSISFVEKNENNITSADNKKQKLENLKTQITNLNIHVNKIKYKNKLLLLIDLGPVVHFDTDKYNIKQQYVKELKNIVNILKDSNESVLIVGHTDSVGSDRYNQALSEMRAREVYKFFIKNEFNASKLDYIGFGEEQPIATNATEEGRAQNRRVELFVDGNISFMYDYLKNRKINIKFLNNHNNMSIGHVEKTIKGWSKNLSESEIKKKFLKLSKPSRQEFKSNLKQRTIIINFPTRKLKEN